MKVVRTNKATCSFVELMHGESEKLQKEVASKLSYPERGQHFVQPPLTRMKGTANRLGDLYLDTELLHRYTRMSLSARRAFVRSIWRTVEKAEVDELVTQVPWGHTITREITATRLPIKSTRKFLLRLAMLKE